MANTDQVTEEAVQALSIGEHLIETLEHGWISVLRRPDTKTRKPNYYVVCIVRDLRASRGTHNPYTAAAFARSYREVK